MHEDNSLTFPLLSVARYSFIQLSGLGRRGENERAYLCSFLSLQNAYFVALVSDLLINSSRVAATRGTAGWLALFGGFSIYWFGGFSVRWLPRLASDRLILFLQGQQDLHFFPNHILETYQYRPFKTTIFHEYLKMRIKVFWKSKFKTLSKEEIEAIENNCKMNVSMVRMITYC